MKSKELLDSFTKYCYENPDLRFWQALRNWCGWNFVVVFNGASDLAYHDTFYWETNKSPEDFKN